MSQLPSVFRTADAPEPDSFDPIPAGTYDAQVTSSDVKPTKAGNGQYISLGFTILGGDYAKRMVWTNLNIVNPNPVAVEIAQKHLRQLCEAIGMPTIDDTQQLHGKPMKIKVSIKPEDDNWPAKNEIKAYYPIAGKAESGSNSNPFE